MYRSPKSSREGDDSDNLDKKTGSEISEPIGQVYSSLHGKESKFGFLSYSTSEMLGLPDTHSIYRYLCEHIQLQYPESIVLAVEVDEDKMDAEVVEVAGLDDDLLLKVTGKLGFQITGKPYKLIGDFLGHLKSGYFIDHTSDLSDFASGSFTKSLGKTLQAMLGIHMIYSIGLSDSDKLHSMVVVMTRHGKSIADKEFLETFIKQAGVVMQQKIMEKQLRFQSMILDQIQDRVTVTDLNGMITYVNNAELEMLRLPRESILGRSVTMYGDNSDKGATQKEIIQNTLQEGKWRGEIVNYAPDGRELVLDVRTRVVKDSDGKPIALCGISTDVTDQKKVEAALRESEHFAKVVANTTPVMLYIYDLKEGRNVWSNDLHKSFIEGLGRKQIEISFQDMLEMIHPDDLYRVVAKIDKVITKYYLDHFDEEIRFRNNVGDWQWMKLLLKVFKKDSKGVSVQMIGAMVDIDKEKKAEHELLLAKLKAEESDRLKTAFLMNMSHEIRTPMNSILGFLNLLENPKLDPEGRKNYIDIMNKSGQRLLTTINSILEISKIESGRLEVNYADVDLCEAIQYQYEAFSPMAMAKNLAFRCECADRQGIKSFRTDRNMLDGMLTNLLNNAFKFTEEGEVVFGYFFEADHVVFFVRDTGAGIPQEKIHQVFERFIQLDHHGIRSTGGSGLGLAICKAYAEVLGGRIWAESEEGKGSTFFVKLPLSPLVKNIPE